MSKTNYIIDEKTGLPYYTVYNHEHKDRIAARMRIWRANNPELIMMQHKDWYYKHKGDKVKIKFETLSHYSNSATPKCVRCQEDDLRCLTLDHIIPIGQQHRRVTGVQFYRKLQVANYPIGYQTLCANCQMKKMFEGNEWTINHKK